jgi:endoglycosylceramidase
LSDLSDAVISIQARAELRDSQVGDMCDEVLASWAYWQFKTYNDLTSSAGNRSEGFYNHDGTLQAKKVKSLSRTYIQAAQGNIVEMKFDSKTGEFNGKIQVNTDIIQDSVIYVHAHDENKETAWYPNGFNI